MIEQILLKDFLSFEKCSFALEEGLMVFTGPSGAGKSVLMNGILSSLALKPLLGSFSQVVVQDNLNAFDIEEGIFTAQKQNSKTRYSIDDVIFSKAKINQITTTFVRHLNHKDLTDFKSQELLGMVDLFVKNVSFDKIKSNYKKNFKAYKNCQKELEELRKNRSNAQNLSEFLEFEVRKIEELNPKEGELENLQKVKKNISKKEKILQSVQEVEGFLQNESVVFNFLNLIDEENAFFEDVLYRLKDKLAQAVESLEELEEIDIESLLDRLEKLSDLVRKYGSIDKALAQKNIKQKELKKYQDLEQSFAYLHKQAANLENELRSLATQMQKMREEAIPLFKKELDILLKKLNLCPCSINFEMGEFTENGHLTIEICLQNTSLERLSSGELSRLRLALLSIKSQESLHKNIKGVLIIDEIDANVSGEEAQQIANLLKSLTSHFQIIAISHRPQLSSLGDKHFLVKKKANSSTVQALDFEQRVEEIARMVSSDTITKEALQYARTMLDKA